MNFPIRSRCVVLRYLRLFFKKNTLFILYRYVVFDQVFYFITICCYILIFLISVLIKKGLVIKTSLDLIYILPYYFYLVLVICYFYLAKTNLTIISIPYLNHVYDKQRKIISPWWFVYVVYCHSLKYFFPRMAFSNVLRIVAKEMILVANYGGDLW